VNDLKWWQKAVFYQIYPRSFADGNGDGIGDFEGIIAKLDYLKALGVDALWLSPHYPSPQIDCGYDISDYTNVAPEYGTLEAFKHFLDEAHKRGLRVILDLVLNHTSDQHPWFIESCASRDNPKRDWYIWHDPAPDGGPPNNWESGFTGPAWEYDEATGQYYYHFFLKEQPDLNWRNPEVKEAMWDAVRFWLDMGVDGFRLDAIGTIFETPGMPDHTAEIAMRDWLKSHYTVESPEEREAIEEQWEELFKHQYDLPSVHDLMKELRALVDTYPDRVLVGEEEKIAYYGNGNDELHLVFNFALMDNKRLIPSLVRDNQEERLSDLPSGAWPCNTFGNHDSGRVYSRFADGQDGDYDDALARLSLALLLTLKGTPFLYNGEEIGMTDLVLTDVSQFQDVHGILIYNLAVEEGLPQEELAALMPQMTRDRCRSPLQWANAPNAGFSPGGVETWLPINPNYAEGINMAEQLADPDSMLNFYKRMLHVRRETPALIAGDYQPLHEDAEDYLAFLRGTDEQTCLVVLNMSPKAHTLRFGLDGKMANGESVALIFSSHERDADVDDLANLAIAPFEIYIAEL